MSSSADSRAKMSARRAKGKDLQVSDQDCGQRCFASSEMYGQRGRLLKMYRPLEVRALSPSFKISARSAIVWNGTAYPLVPLAPLTKGTASGSWPTPTLIHAKRGNHDEPLEKYEQRVKDYKEGRAKGKPGKSLGVAVRMWPTPDASPHKYRLKGDSQQSRSLNGLHGGKLSPDWTEWLMGFPQGWTDV